MTSAEVVDNRVRSLLVGAVLSALIRVEEILVVFPMLVDVADTYSHLAPAMVWMIKDRPGLVYHSTMKLELDVEAIAKTVLLEDVLIAL